MLDGGAGSEFVVYGSVPWSASWLTEQNLADALAEHADVLYVEPPRTPLTPFRDRRDMAAVREAARLLTGRVARVAPRIHVLRPLEPPGRSARPVAALGRPLVRAQVGAAVRRLGFTSPTAIAARAVPECLGAARESFFVYLVKDKVEAGAHLLGKRSESLVARKREMCERVDLICCASEALQDSIASLGYASELIRHGFHTKLVRRYEAGEPKEYRALPRPLLGYTGTIDDRLSFETLIAVCRRLPGASVVLVGPVSRLLGEEARRVLAELPNLHLLGPRPREDIPAYVSHLDCSLLPYRDDDWLRHAAPLKIWDYLYAGRPIVGSGCLAIRAFAPPYALFAESPEAFADAVEQALGEGDAHRRRRRSLALANGWDVRAKQLTELIALGRAASARA